MPRIRPEIDDARMFDDDAYVQLKDSQKIDTGRLDIGLSEQAHLFGNAGVHYARAMERQVSAKFRMEVTEAQLDKDLREQLTADGEKFTEKRLESLIKLEPEYQQAYKRWSDAKYRADCWSHLVESYRQRGFSLKDLVSLRNYDYLEEQLGTGSVNDRLRSLDRQRIRQ